MEAIVLGSVALGLLAWAWWTERGGPRTEKTIQKLPVVEKVAVSGRIGGEKSMMRGVSKFQKYSTEAEVIKKHLRDHDAGVRINSSERAILTPKTVVFPLQMARGRTLSKLYAAISPIQVALFHARKRQGHTEELRALVIQQPLSLIIPRVDPVTLSWDDRKEQAKPRHMLTGLSYATGRPNPLYLDLDSPLQFSVLLGGSSGSGKSTLLDGMVLSACEASTPDDLKVMFVDIGKKHFGAFEELPHCNGFAHTVDGAKALLQHVESEMSGPENQYDARTVIVIDEVQKLTKCGLDREEKEFKRLLMMIASNGRAYGYSIVISTQKPYAGVVPTPIRDNCVTRIAGRCMSFSQSEMILGDKRTEATSLNGVGSFVVDDGHSTQVVYSYMIDSQPIIDSIVDKHGGYDGVFFDFEGEYVETEETADTEGIPQSVLEVFEQHYDDGNLRRGYLGKAVAAYADHVGMASGGDNYYKFKDIIGRMAEEYLESADEHIEYRREGTTGKVIRIGDYR